MMIKKKSDFEISDAKVNALALNGKINEKEKQTKHVNDMKKSLLLGKLFAYIAAGVLKVEDI